MSNLNNADKAAYPLGGDGGFNPGLTKREQFAAMAMQGLMAYSSQSICNAKFSELATASVDMADELLKALENDK